MKMRAKNSRIVRLISLMVILLLVFCGCGKKKETVTKDDNQTVVFQYGNSIVTLGEAYIYYQTVGERYEAQYGADVWSLQLDGENGEKIPMVDVVKEAVVEEIVQVKTLVAHASDYKIELSEDEKAIVTEDATNFYDGLTDQDIENMELTYEKVYQVMEENVVADKVTEAILVDNPIEVSDEQARMTTFYDMYFQCYSINSSGEIVPYSAEERDIQYQNALQACSTLATASLDGDRDAGNIETLAEYYQLENAKEQTITPEAIYETYGEEVYNLLYSMEPGEFSTVIETEYGYHVFQMIALTDPKATNARKEVIKEEMMIEAIEERLMAWQLSIDKEFSYEDSVNMEIYDKIMFH